MLRKNTGYLVLKKSHSFHLMHSGNAQNVHLVLRSTARIRAGCGMPFAAAGPLLELWNISGMTREENLAGREEIRRTTSGRIFCRDVISSVVRNGGPRRAYRTRALRMRYVITFHRRTGLGLLLP